MKKNFTKEDGYRNLENINSWINNSDTKASILLGLIGVFLTMLFSDSSFFKKIFAILNNALSKITFSDILYLIFIILSIILFLLGVFKLFKVLVPTLKIKINSKRNSILYFGSISEHQNCKDFKLSVLEIEEEDLIDDILNQIYINSTICKNKFDNFTFGFKYSIFGMILFCVLFIIGLIVY